MKVNLAFKYLVEVVAFPIRPFHSTIKASLLVKALQLKDITAEYESAPTSIQQHLRNF